MTRSVRGNRSPSARSDTSSATMSNSMESTPDSSKRAFTPGSDTSPSITIEPADGIRSQPSGQSEHDASASFAADQAIPSIETPESLSLDGFTPPPSTTPSSPTSSRAGSAGVVREGRVTGSIATRLGNMRISSSEPIFDMSNMGAAIEEVPSGSSNQVSIPRPRHLSSPAERSIPRRRSSPRVSISIHDLRKEEPPKDLFHEPVFQQAFADAKRQMSHLTDVLQSSVLHIDPDSTMRRLHGEADKLANFQCPSSRTVGFVGDSGVGT